MALEIERKFLIEMPDLNWIVENTECKIAYIVQTYLGKNESGFGNRVRRMKIDNEVKYYHTAKKSVSGITRIEIEKEISKAEYERFLEKKSKVISLKKTRYIAIMEVELKNEKQKFDIPDFIKIIGEVTNNMDYTNQSLAKKYGV